MRFACLSSLTLLLSASLAWVVDADFMLSDVDNPQNISFKDAITRALSHNVELKKTEQGVIIAKSEAGIARSEHLPKIIGLLSHDVDNRIPLGEVSRDSKASIKLSTPLLDAKALVDIKAKNELQIVANEKYQHEQDATIYQVGSLYIEALLAKSDMDIAFEELEQYKRQAVFLEKKELVGSARALDVMQAQYRSNNAYSEYLLKRQDYQKALGELGRKIGLGESFVLAVVEISSSYLDKDDAELRALALSSTDMNMVRSDIKAAEWSLMSDKFGFLPKLSASIEGGWRLGHDNSKSPRGFSMSVGVELELPLFSGGSSLFAIKKGVANKTMSELTLLSKTQEKQFSVTGLNQQRKDWAIVKASAGLAFKSATVAKESAERLFALGEITGVEMVEAITNYSSAKSQLMSAELKLERVKLKLLYIIGKVKELL